MDMLTVVSLTDNLSRGRGIDAKLLRTKEISSTILKLMNIKLEKL